MSALSAVSLGANAAEQGIDFAIGLALGLAAGIFALIYLRRSSGLERALTDLFATLAIAAIYILAAEFIYGGEIELHTLISYLIGVAMLPSVVRFARGKIKSKKNKH